MTQESEWISTPAGKFRRPISADVPTAAITAVIGDEERVMVCVARPALSPENMDNTGADRELEVIATFGLDSEGLGGHLATLQGLARLSQTPSRNAPCPCGSGKKYKQCHGGVAGG